MGLSFKPEIYFTALNRTVLRPHPTNPPSNRSIIWGKSNLSSTSLKWRKIVLVLVVRADLLSGPHPQMLVLLANRSKITSNFPSSLRDAPRIRYA